MIKRLELVVIGVIVLVLIGIIFGAIATSKAKEEFIAECTQHQLKYECEALWAQMQPNNDTITVFTY